MTRSLFVVNILKASLQFITENNFRHSQKVISDIKHVIDFLWWSINILSNTILNFKNIRA